MYQEKKKIHFFLGVNTPQGFVSRFEQLTDQKMSCRYSDWRYFIIKGTAGSGKSTLLRKVAQVFEDRFDDIEYIRCATDPDSLDAIILPTIHVSIVDGTAPHSLEPKYAGASEIVINLFENYDEKLLFEKRDEIVDLIDRAQSKQDLCCRFLGAASSLLYDTYQIALEQTDTAKVTKLAARLSAREFKPKVDAQGSEDVRFLTAVTSQGHMALFDTAEALADRIYLLEDDYGAFSRILLGYIRSCAMSAGYHVVSCYCPLSPHDKLEHLFVPELGVGFVTANRFHTPNLVPYKVINARRFTNLEELKLRKRRISFNRKAATQMLEQAVTVMAEARTIHLELEAIYGKAVNYDYCTTITARTIDRIESIAATQEKLRTPVRA